MIKVKVVRQTRVCQGDIIREVAYIERISEIDGILEISRVVYPLVIVLTQDCDLEQDFKFRKEADRPSQDKRLVSVLVAPLYNADHVFAGEHLKDLKISSEKISSSKFRNLTKTNQRPRYHYLEFPRKTGVVDSVIDYKHYFSVSLEYLQAQKRNSFVCTISGLYREDVSQRFAAFLSRIGLPDIKIESSK